MQYIGIPTNVGHDWRFVGCVKLFPKKIHPLRVDHPKPRKSHHFFGDKGSPNLRDFISKKFGTARGSFYYSKIRNNSLNPFKNGG